MTVAAKVGGSVELDNGIETDLSAMKKFSVSW